jgi:hypothetical protein
MQAVQFLLASRERLNSQNSDSKVEETKFQQLDPIQVSCSFSMADFTSKIPKITKEKGKGRILRITKVKN